MGGRVGVPLVRESRSGRVGCGGNADFTASSLGDVTEQLRTAAALKVSEVHLAQVVASAMDAVICTTPDGVIILFNQMAERMFSLEASLAISRSLEALLPGWRHDAPGVLNEPPRALCTLTGLRADGREFPAEVTISDSTAPEHAGVLATITVIVRDDANDARSGIASCTEDGCAWSDGRRNRARFQ